MTEVDSPRSAVGLGRRFASCDLYPVYSCCPSSFPPGIPRDVCGYLTRENNLRKYIALTCPVRMQPGRRFLSYKQMPFGSLEFIIRHGETLAPGERIRGELDFLVARLFLKMTQRKEIEM